MWPETHQRLQLRSRLAAITWASSASTARSTMAALWAFRLADIWRVRMSQARTSPPAPPVIMKPERLAILMAVTPTELPRA